MRRLGALSFLGVKILSRKERKGRKEIFKTSRTLRTLREVLFYYLKRSPDGESVIPFADAHSITAFQSFVAHSASPHLRVRYSRASCPHWRQGAKKESGAKAPHSKSFAYALRNSEFRIKRPPFNPIRNCIYRAFRCDNAW